MFKIGKNGTGSATLLNIHYYKIFLVYKHCIASKNPNFCYFMFLSNFLLSIRVFFACNAYVSFYLIFGQSFIYIVNKKQTTKGLLFINRVVWIGLKNTHTTVQFNVIKSLIWPIVVWFDSITLGLFPSRGTELLSTYST